MLGEGATLGVDNLLSRGVKVFPGRDRRRRRDPVLSRSDAKDEQVEKDRMETQEQLVLDRAAVAKVDTTDQITDILALPEHLRDALWKAESANLGTWDSPAGLVVAGHGWLGHGRDARPRDPG